MKRRLFIGLAAAVFIIGIAVALWFLFYPNTDSGISIGNPFSGLDGGGVAPASGLPTEGVLRQAGEELAPRFVQVTEGPVSRGLAAVRIRTAVDTATAPNSTTSPAAVLGEADTEFRFIDRASGNVYAYTARARTLSRINNRTVPGIQEAAWVADGSRAYGRFLSSAATGERVDTISLPATGGEGFLLDQGLSQALVAGTSTLVTVFPGTTGSVVSIARADGTNARTLLSSVLSALVVHPTVTGPLYAMTKPSTALSGYAFRVDRTSGALSRILGPLSGLSILPSPDGSRVLYSTVEGGSVRLRVLDVTSRISTALPVATLAEKCVWLSDSSAAYCGVPIAITGQQPDAWYQGVTAFTDRVWRIDIQQRIAALVVDPRAVADISVDAVGLAVDRDADFLSFTDKASGALYVYDL